jgi:CRP-like cAMP-binding protein
VNKKEILHKEAQKRDKYYYIDSGCLRVFCSTDGEENTIQFFFEDSWYVPNPDENIQAIEKSRVIQFSKIKMSEFFLKYPNMQNIGIVLSQQGVECSHDRVKKLVNMTSEELYLDLLKNGSEIVKRIPQKYVASYLNIQPESLSRIRRRILNT